MPNWENTEVGDLTAAASLTGAETLHVVQSGNSRRTTAQAIADLANVSSGGGLLAANNLADVDDPAAALANLGGEEAGTAAAAVTAHEAAGDPHPQYVTAVEQTTALGSYATSAAVAAGYQPLDADLTAIAALTTTAFGRALLETADAAAGRTAFGLGTASTLSTADVDERARDAVGTALTAGSNITITPNDGADTITIAAIGGITVDALNGTIAPRTGTSFGNGFVGLRPFVVPFDMTATGVRFRATAAAGTAVVEPVVYDSNAAGDVGSRLANGSSVTGVAQGNNTLPFSSGLALTAGQLVWVGINLQTASVTMANQNSPISAHFSQGSIPAPSSPGSLTYGTQAWASMWLYGTA